RKLHKKKMKPVRVYFVCSFLRGLYCLKVCSFQLMENRRVSILKLMGMWRYPCIERYGNMEVKNKLENIIWHIKTNRVVLGDKRTLNDVLVALENMVEEKVIVAPVDDVILQSHQFTKQLGVVTSVLKEVRKSNIKEIENL
ncbi:hypothetical protein ACIKJQ_21425, partial [Bacillus thuringiensis]